MIRTVLVDIDDTLLDFTLGERMALQQAFLQARIPYDALYASIYHDVNQSWWRRYDRGEVTVNRVVIERFVELFRRIGKPMPLNFAMLYEENLRRQHAFIRGAKGFLQRVGRDFGVYAVSNGRTVVQRQRLADSGLDRMIDGVFISEEMGYHKPQKEYFDVVAASIEGYLPTTTVIVGDSLSSDIAGGHVAGIHTVWYNRNHAPLTGGVAPDYETDDFHQIEAYIRSL